MFPLIVILIIGAIIAAVVYSSIAAKKRRQDLAALASRLSLRFSESNDYSLPETYGFLHELNQGDNRYAYNILSGQYKQNQVLVFDYHYETHSTDSKGHRETHHHYFSFFIMTLPANFPDLKITREGWLTRIAEVFGYSDIKFESAEFSKSFCVRSNDKKFAYDVCNAKMIDYLLGNRDLSIEIQRNVISLAFGSCLSVFDIERDLERLENMRLLLPTTCLQGPEMSPVVIIIVIAVVVLPVVWFVAQYNALVSLRNYIRESWSDVDTELKRRYDLIPNLVATVKGYAAHEKEVLERVTALRNQCVASTGSPGEQAKDEVQLVAALKQLMVVVENYPQLKADAQFLKLQQELINTKDRIQASRRFYNGNVRDYLTRCQTFPSNLVANMFGFKAEDLFTVPPSVRDVPNTDFSVS